MSREESQAPELPWWQLARFISRLTLRHPILLTVAVVAAVGVAMTGIVSIGLLFPFLDSVGGDALSLPADSPLAIMAPLFAGMDATSKIRLIAGLLVGIQLFRGALSYAESRVSAYLRILIERDIREKVFDDLLRVELRYIHGERTANLQTLLHQYPRQSADIVDQYLAALTKGVSTVTYALALLVVSVPLTLIALALGIGSILAVQVLNRAVKRNARATNETRVRLQQTSLESLNSMRIIRLFAREDEARERFSRDVMRMQRQSFRGASLRSAMAPIQGLVNMLLIATLIVAATYVLPKQNGDAWLLVLTGFLIIVMRLTGPLQSFTKKRAKIISEIPALEQVVHFLESPKPFLKDGSRRVDGVRHGIRFEDVTFAYEAGAKPALERVSLEIPRGRKVAIVGGSGSGKSTLLALLARLADPDEGRVLVDGVDLRDVQIRSWRRRLAYVSQENHLFHDTVRNNIRFAKPEATDEEVEQAARLARAHEFIVKMESGYDTLVGERGARLSGGQAQRLAIARALLADPDVLVLDEATSALDAATERAVQEAIEAASHGRTVISVAHRLATVRSADCIFVLEKGRIVQQGAHDELFAQPGPYRDYVLMQDLTGVPPAAAPPRPMRVVLGSGRGMASVVRGDEPPRPVQVVSAASGSDAWALARGSGVDVAVLATGSPTAVVRVGGAVEGGVPLFTRRADGVETRVRIKTVAQAAADATSAATPAA